MKILVVNIFLVLGMALSPKAKRTKEDSLEIVNRPIYIANENSELLKRGMKTISVCRPVNELCVVWAPNYSGTGWHETNISFNISMEKNRRFLHIIENTGEWNNRDTTNYYPVAFFRDLEQRNAPPDLNVGFVRKIDVIKE